jgi:hypothetical protein
MYLSERGVMPFNYRLRGRSGTATAARALDGSGSVVGYLSEAAVRPRVPGVSLVPFNGTHI